MDDGKVFDKLFGPSEPPSVARSASEINVTLSGIPDLPNVDVDAMIRAIDKLEACIARLKRFLMVNQ